ncbi:MAG: penicillin acylase family protein [Acidobacteriales bacterium]|nr:penicillin acylase family protein [Terriglobales bacterium]
MRRLRCLISIFLLFVVSACNDYPLQVEWNLETPGLHEPVTILRDHWGVAHIYAANQHDLFFAQGYNAASDRLFQLELWKRAGQGRLAEILGPSVLKRDINARLLRYRGPMEQEYASYSADTKEILEAFTAGINAYISAHKSDLTPDFKLAGFAPEPWKPEDCLSRMAAFHMAGNASDELYHAELVAQLGPERAAELLDLDPPTKLEGVAGMNYSGLSSDLLRDIVSSDTRIEFPAQGSNNWTVSGKLTASGKPMLANDPHRAITLPSLRYIVHLVAPGSEGKKGWDVVGAGEPALPGVAIGHNRSIAWGLTIFNIDQQDFYLEQLNPNDPLLYKTETGWERMRVEREQIKIKGQAPVEVELKFNRHGPVLWEDVRSHRALALRWAGAEPGTSGYLASLALDRAENWEEFLAAMRRWKLPPENFVYADVQGNIGEQSAGLAPRRNWTGLVPMPGDRKYEWQGFRKLEDLPRSFNPAAGFIATANHKMIPPNDPRPVGFEWAPPYRFERIKEVLSSARYSGRKLQLADMEALQNDAVSLPAQRLLKLLAQSPAKDESEAKLLLSWDATLAHDSAPAALYEVWLRNLRHALTRLAVPQNLSKRVEVELPMPVLLRWLENPERGPLAALPAAGGVTVRDTLLAGSLKRAWHEMSQLQGTDPKAWSWGKLHVVRFRHPLDWLRGGEGFNLGPIERPGDSYTVNSTGTGGRSFEQTGGASFREILDLSDWDKSLAINTPGQSGVPGEKHYSDLLPLWVEGEYFPLLYSREAVEQNLERRVVLRPASRN